MSLTARIVIGRRLSWLPPHIYTICLHFLFQGELSTLRKPRGYAQMAAAKNLAPQPLLVHQTADKYAVRSYVADTVRAAFGSLGIFQASNVAAIAAAR